ncbi:MAG: cation diffusion facilitator family transporter [Bacteroidota bacterium]
MPRQSSIRTVIGALLANAAIAIVKFVAAAATGSSAMLAEAIHSVVDTGDSILLLLGMRLASRPPDERHPFGHGRDAFFWSFVVAMLIFGVGGGVTAYEGILRLRAPAPVRHVTASYVVLGAAALFETISLVIGLKALLDYRRRRLPGTSLFRTMHLAKDPTMITVVLEDSAALAGLLIAFLGVFLSTTLHRPVFDGAASLLIGLMLAGVAVILGAECRGLIVGERALPDVVAGARELLRVHPAVREVREVNTMQIGPDEVLLTVSLGFRADLSDHALGRAARDLDRALRERFPEIKRVLLEAGSLSPAG